MLGPWLGWSWWWSERTLREGWSSGPLGQPLLLCLLLWPAWSFSFPCSMGCHVIRYFPYRGYFDLLGSFIAAGEWVTGEQKGWSREWRRIARHPLVLGRCTLALWLLEEKDTTTPNPRIQWKSLHPSKWPHIFSTMSVIIWEMKVSGSG